MALIKENEEKKFDKHILKSGACDLACTAVLGCSPVQDSSQAPLLVRGGKKIQKNIIWGSLAHERWDFFPIILLTWGSLARER